MKLHYVTGNQQKFNASLKYLGELEGIELVHTPLAINEFQTEDINEISREKAIQAWGQLHEPLFVNDAGWEIPAVNGFPGPFMAFVTRRFTPEDWLRLMDGIEDRRVIAREVITFYDGEELKQFVVVRDSGVFLNEARGEGQSIDQVVSCRKDGLSIAEADEKGLKNIEGKSGWDEFREWLVEYL